jgi:hypothetical protein
VQPHLGGESFRVGTHADKRGINIPDGNLHTVWGSRYAGTPGGRALDTTGTRVASEFRLSVSRSVRRLSLSFLYVISSCDRRVRNLLQQALVGARVAVQGAGFYGTQSLDMTYTKDSLWLSTGWAAMRSKKLKQQRSSHGVARAVAIITLARQGSRTAAKRPAASPRRRGQAC